MSTWYRPPDSPVSLFNEIDSGNQEFFLLGDINVDFFFPDTTVSNVVKLKNILVIHDLDQLITEPTRITLNSRSLVDLCIVNSPLKIANCGVVQLAISDHALIYIPRKAHYQRTGSRIIKTRQMRNFHKANFLRDIQQKAWPNI